MIDQASGGLTAVKNKLSSRCVRGASALALGAMLVTWSGVARAQTPSATSVQLAGTTNVPTDATKYNITVSCTALAAEEQCRVTFADNAAFSGASTVSGLAGVRAVEVPGLVRTKTYSFFTNALLRVGKGKSATVIASSDSSVVSYSYGQALPKTPAPTAVQTPAATPAPVVAPSSTAALPPVTLYRAGLGGRTCALVPGTTFLANAKMPPGSGFESPNGKYMLRFETNGRLRIVEKATSKILWETAAPSASPQHAIMYGDGRLKVTTLDGNDAWATPTQGNENAIASLLDSGDLVIYPAYDISKDFCKELWSALKGPVATVVTAPPSTSSGSTARFGTTMCGIVRGTTLSGGGSLWAGQRMPSPSFTYELAYQADGNAVVIQTDNQRKVVWSSKTSGTAPGRLLMGTDGVVVVYKNDGTVAWKSSNGAREGAVLSMQDDGNLVVYAKDSCTALWSSR